MTQVVNTLTQWREIAATLPAESRIGLVPTMGNLHQGHASLLERAKRENSLCLLTIFINPTQFNNAHDLQNYPVTLDADLAIAQQLGVDYVFIPSVTEMYPDQYTYQLHETDISQDLEGAHRPGHFTGMLTVVLKLLLLFTPHKAYFGEKDWQQLELVRGLAQAFFLQTEIVPCPTVRDEWGLALSSRNARLSPSHLELARQFARCLKQGTRCEQIIKQLTALNITIDYVEDRGQRRIAAVHIGGVRLLDNIPI
jgi:pantoate--beta-alanine ligase